MCGSLSKREIDRAFKLMRLSSEKQRQFYRKLVDSEEGEKTTTLFIRSTIGTGEKDKEEEIARLE
jgi:hypothetical protein